MSKGSLTINEKDTLLHKQLDSIAAEIDSLPKGTIQMKQIRGIEYPYLVYRLNGKHVTELVNKSICLDTLQKQIDRRRMLKSDERRLKQDLRIIERGMNK